MAESLMSTISDYYRSRHTLVLERVDTLDDHQLRWRPNATTPPIAFHLWHMARWADYLQEMIAAGAPQVWEREQLETEWGFVGIELGFAQTGMGIDEDILSSLPFPARPVLFDYVQKAFGQADRAVAGVEDAQFHRVVSDRHGAEWKETTVGDAIVGWLVHDSRHLGMIECLLGVQGLQGTATR